LFIISCIFEKGKSDKFSHNNKKISKCAVLFHKEQGVTHYFFTNAIKATNIYCVLDRWYFLTIGALPIRFSDDIDVWLRRVEDYVLSTSTKCRFGFLVWTSSANCFYLTNIWSYSLPCHMSFLWWEQKSIWILLVNTRAIVPAGGQFSFNCSISRAIIGFPRAFAYQIPRR